MKKSARLAASRLNKVLMTDKLVAPEKLNDLVKSEVLEVLESYFEVFPSTFELKITSAEGVITLEMQLKASRVKSFGSFCPPAR